MQMREMRDYRAPGDPARGDPSKVRDFFEGFLACVILVAGLGGAAIVGDDLRDCRLAVERFERAADDRAAIAEAFGTGRARP